MGPPPSAAHDWCAGEAPTPHFQARGCYVKHEKRYRQTEAESHRAQSGGAGAGAFNYPWF